VNTAAKEGEYGAAENGPYDLADSLKTETLELKTSLPPSKAEQMLEQMFRGYVCHGAGFHSIDFIQKPGTKYISPVLQMPGRETALPFRA